MYHVLYVSVSICVIMCHHVSSRVIVYIACGVAHQALESIAPLVGEDVLVLGCGPVGLLAVGIARALGATKVYGPILALIL